MPSSHSVCFSLTCFEGIRVQRFHPGFFRVGGVTGRNRSVAIPFQVQTLIFFVGNLFSSGHSAIARKVTDFLST